MVTVHAHTSLHLHRANLEQLRNMRLPFVVVILLFAQAFAKSHRFRDIASEPVASGLNYRRVPSRNRAKWLETLRKSLDEPIPFRVALEFPWGVHGQPGVAVGDFNGDGYDDIYVTNGPGAANSLFINEYGKTGRLKFRDTAKAAGVAASEQDSTGVCYGDLNGDGHPDLVVLSEFDSNKMFLSNGDGTFREVSWMRATGDSSTYPSASCAIGDVNNDGKLDLLIANGVPRGTYKPCLAVPFDLNKPNQLFINTGKAGSMELSFDDRSLTSGINDFGGDVPKGKYTLTWTATLIDIDLDGNLDIVVADDQCGLATKAENATTGGNRGAIRIQTGDGTGNFKSRTLQPVNSVQNGRRQGGETWMGLGFGDFNCDGKMDFFGSNFGDYHHVKVVVNEGRVPDGKLGFYSSRWFLADNSPQGYTDASVKETGATVFGWGNGVWDYDNDGDQDIVMVGSLDEPRAAGSDNPNVIYKNNGCKAKFSYDLDSLVPTGSLRNYNGLAIGDFNLDGFPDLVGASGYRSKPELLSRIIDYKSPLDKTAYFTDILDLNPNGTFTWTGNLVDQGDMMVQINSPDKSKCWAIVQPVGMQGILSNAKVNRGGLGSTIIMKPKGMKAVMTPIVSGESFGSQHSPKRNFGLGKRCTGTVDVIWPQGVRNRLYKVRHKDIITIPEIPCSFTGNWKSELEYKECVDQAATELISKELYPSKYISRLRKGMLKARSQYLRSS